MSASDIREAVETNATGPKRAKGDEGEVEQHSLSEQDAIASKAVANEAAAQPHRGIRFTQISPPG